MLSLQRSRGGSALEREPDNGDLFTIDGLSDNQLWCITRHKEFVSSYGSLATGDPSKGWKTYSDFIIKEIKKDPSKFNKKHQIREY